MISTKTLGMMFIGAVLIGCVTPVDLGTASGRPEITTNVSMDRLKPELMAAMMNRGYSMHRDSGVSLSMEKPLTGMAAAFFGSRYDPNPAARITFTFIQSTDQLRLIADMAMVTNPGSGYERLTPANRSQDARIIQSFLEDLKARIEAQ